MSSAGKGEYKRRKVPSTGSVCRVVGDFDIPAVEATTTEAMTESAAILREADCIVPNTYPRLDDGPVKGETRLFLFFISCRSVRLLAGEQGPVGVLTLTLMELIADGVMAMGFV